jgi:late competence protein required for DNA uptake (superfamily II DNA/RNA helicase)
MLITPCWVQLHYYSNKLSLYSSFSNLLLMEEWDPAVNDFVLRCNSCWRTNKNKYTKIIRTPREKYYCEHCLSMYDNLCHC